MARTVQTRRESLGLLGASSLAALDACGGNSETDRGADASECAAKGESTVGPFPNLGPLDRKDIRGNTSGDTAPKTGADLTLRVRVLDRDAFCAPLAGAVVEIWQCDAVGLYAGYGTFTTEGQDFCRGAQTTDAQGLAEFLTIFPGSYTGRALHLHVSIRNAAGTLPPNSNGNTLLDVFVSQLYFQPEVAAEIFEAFPIYQQGAPITPNEADGFFPAGGSDLLVDMTGDGAGYLGEVTIPVLRSEVGL